MAECTDGHTPSAVKWQCIRCQRVLDAYIESQKKGKDIGFISYIIIFVILSMVIVFLTSYLWTLGRIMGGGIP